MPPGVSEEILQQRRYYERTAGSYDMMHVSDDDEHARALGAFVGLADVFGPVESVLDVGAGTGRAMAILQRRWQEATIMGVEPVAELRKIGHGKGISPTRLVSGDALRLDYPDDAFDYVIETGMLHHVAMPGLAIAEMARVARRGIMISDVNNFAGGSTALQLLKTIVKHAKLWSALIWIQTRGRMYKSDEGDGIFYSFSVFDHLHCFRTKFPAIHFMNTVPCRGGSLTRHAGGVMVFATIPNPRVDLPTKLEQKAERRENAG